MSIDEEATFQFHANGSTATAALLLHGYMGTPRELRPLGEALAAAGVTTRGELLPGFGKEGRPQLGRVRAEDWLDAARAAWLEVTRGAAHRTLIGFSMGGALALTLAADPAVRPDALVLLAPYWRMADRRAVLLPVAHFVMPRFQPFGKLDFTDPATRLTLAEAVPGVDLDDPDVQRSFQEEMTVPTHSLHQLRRLGLRASRARLAPQTSRVIVQGLQDPTTLPQDSRDLSRMIGARLIEVPADHMLVDQNAPAWERVRDAVLSRAVPKPGQSG
ncbi:MAG: alpha/beta fold hydrolase [Thermomicrobiales bacterium]|nr:alpha/beta fold hydrolase [Thermomicrobiales bacterium]